MKTKITKLLEAVGRGWLAVLIVAGATLIFHQKASQAPVWLAPYLSGAANGSPCDPWMVDPASVDEMKQMDVDQRWSHRFEPAVDRSVLVEFKSMDPGWMWVVWLARKLMPFWGDLCAVSVLTVLMHHGLAALVCQRLTSPAARGAFLLLYLANPLVLHVVTMPYYYGWQAVASLAALLLVISPTARRWPYMLLIIALLLLCVAIRPNVILVALAAVLYATYVSRAKAQWALAALFLAVLVSIPKVNKPFWHTAYVGLGAYPNSHGLYLSDDSAAAAYLRETGEKYTAEVGGKFHDPAFRARYDAKLKELCLRLVKEDPLLPLRDAALNACITFAWVYKPGMPYALYLSLAVLGLVILAWLVMSRQVLALTGVLLTAGVIVPYYPPIAAYVVGAYVFLALGLASAITATISVKK